MIGSRLVFQRKRAGLTQAGLANKLKVSVKTVKNWESDTSDPTLKSLLALCELFHISADELLGREGDSVSLTGVCESDKARLKRAIQALLDS